MGEYAEMMLDGSCCPQCGEFIDFDGPGYPVLCPACKAEERRQPRVPAMQRYGKHNTKVAKPSDPIRQGDKLACPFCVRLVKVTGFGDHMLTQHRDKWPAGATMEGRKS